MSKSSCINLPANDFFMVTRQCYLDICGNDECAAKLPDILVNLHDWRLSMGDSDPKQPVLQNHIYEELQKHILKTFGITKIKRSIALLVKSGFLRIHSNPSYKLDQTHHYEVIPSAIQQKLDSLDRQKEVLA